MMDGVQENQADADWAKVVGRNKPHAKRKRQEAFAKVPLKQAARAAASCDGQRMMVWLFLLHRSWKLQRASFAVPSGALRCLGVGREVQRRALRDFEDAGLILVERRGRKNPIVTLVGSVYER
jgi:hypothetical protein